MKYYSKKKLYQKNYQYINYHQKNYKNYKIILTAIYEKNIYNILLVRQNIQSFLYLKKMTNNDYVQTTEDSTQLFEKTDICYC